MESIEKGTSIDPEGVVSENEKQYAPGKKPSRDEPGKQYDKNKPGYIPRQDSVRREQNRVNQ